jgi:hypothetical protein
MKCEQRMRGRSITRSLFSNPGKRLRTPGGCIRKCAAVREDSRAGERTLRESQGLRETSGQFAGNDLHRIFRNCLELVSAEYSIR